MKTTTTLLGAFLITSFFAACGPAAQVRPEPAQADLSSSSSSAQAVPVIVEVNLSESIQAAPPSAKESREYRFLLTGHDGQRLDLHLWVDGKEVCRMAGRLSAEIHAHQYAKGPRLDRACVFPAPVANEKKVLVRLQGYTLDPAGQRTEVDSSTEAEFEGFVDGWIELQPDGQVTISFPKG